MNFTVDATDKAQVQRRGTEFIQDNRQVQVLAQYHGLDELALRVGGGLTYPVLNDHLAEVLAQLLREPVFAHRLQHLEKTGKENITGGVAVTEPDRDAQTEGRRFGWIGHHEKGSGRG